MGSVFRLPAVQRIMQPRCANRSRFTLCHFRYLYTSACGCFSITFLFASQLELDVYKRRENTPGFIKYGNINYISKPMQLESYGLRERSHSACGDCSISSIYLQRHFPGTPPPPKGWVELKPQLMSRIRLDGVTSHDHQACEKKCQLLRYF